ncbi:MAG: RNA-directed DNA polymerase [Pirellulaceae bacterium]|nr:RNA-directed DNA polymerase [Pirellulaceae bacterium]
MLNDPESPTKRWQMLADILLHCRWTSADHLALGMGAIKRQPNAVRNMIAAIHQAFPWVPSRTQLVTFLASRSDLLKGLRWKRLPDIQCQRRLYPTTMQPTRFAQQTWEPPPLPTLGSVADDLLRLPASLVEWLSNPRVQHYVVSVIAKRGSAGSAGTGAATGRILEQPKRLLKAAQRDILREILRDVPAHPAAHGFVPHRSVVTFAKPHTGRPVVVRMDLANFFTSIPAARVNAVFRSLGYPLPVAHQLTNLCTTACKLDAVEGLADYSAAERVRLENLYGRPHLPQGAPTSPALANLVAYRLDARLSGLARRVGCEYTRYADDLLFSGDRRLLRQAQSLVVQVSAIALDEGFQVQHRKTRIMTQAVLQAAAGVVLNQHTNIDRRDYDNLKATLTNCVRHGPATQNHLQHPNYREHLLGRIGWVHHLNPTRGSKLMRIFERIQWPN